MDLSNFIINNNIDYTKIYESLPVDVKDHSIRVAKIGQFLYELCFQNDVYKDEDILKTNQKDKIFQAITYHDLGKYGQDPKLDNAKAKIEQTEKAFEMFEIGLSSESKSFDIVISLAFESAVSQFENWDGSGIPSGFSGDAIPLIARITSIANQADYLLVTKKMGVETAIVELLKQSGIIFDPTLVGLLGSNKTKFRKLLLDLEIEKEDKETKRKAKPQAVGSPLQLNYQPVFDYMKNKTVYLDTQLKLTDRYYGPVPFDVFMTIAEKSNQICELDKWALEEACEAIHRLEEKNVIFDKVIVRMSAKHMLKKTLIPTVAKILKKTEQSSSKIIIELSDKNLNKVDDELILAVNQLKDLGFSLILSDFGSENASLARLEKLEVDAIKFDKEFIGQIMENKKSREIVRSMIDMAQKLQMRIIAEGVDTKEQEETLIGLGCTMFQGQYHGRPVSENQLARSI